MLSVNIAVKNILSLHPYCHCIHIVIASRRFIARRERSLLATNICRNQLHVENCLRGRDAEGGGVGKQVPPLPFPKEGNGAMVTSAVKFRFWNCNSCWKLVTSLHMYDSGLELYWILNISYFYFELQIIFSF